MTQTLLKTCITSESVSQHLALQTHQQLSQSALFQEKPLGKEKEPANGFVAYQTEDYQSFNAQLKKEWGESLKAEHVLELSEDGLEVRLKAMPEIAAVIKQAIEKAGIKPLDTEAPETTPTVQEFLAVHEQKSFQAASKEILRFNGNNLREDSGIHPSLATVGPNDSKKSEEEKERKKRLWNSGPPAVAQQAATTNLALQQALENKNHGG